MAIRRAARGVLCVLAAALLLMPTWGQTASAAVRASSSGAVQVAAVLQLAGADRYETAAVVARSAYPSGSPAVVLTTGEAWPDAVSASALAGVAHAPVLLTARRGIPYATRAAIGELAPSTVYVVGGERAIPSATLASLGGLGVSSSRVVRLAGSDRYATAAEVSSAVLALDGESIARHAYVATGRDFADALSVGPVAAAQGSPLLLTDPGRYDETIEAIVDAGITRVTLVGGPAVVAEEFETRLATALGGREHVGRLAGATRYSTALRVAEHADRELGFGYDRLGLATGRDWADAASAGPLLAIRRDPLVLVAPDGVPDELARWLYGRTSEFTAFGGGAAIPTHVREEIQIALRVRPFEIARAMGHIGFLAGLGPRRTGGGAERAAFDYIAGELEGYGYSVSTQPVYLPSGAMSRNVIAEKRGSEPGVLVLGAHVDSKHPSPGANDNASGVAVMLELARIFADADTVPTVRFIAFGAEEISGPTPADHHFGSQQYVSSLSSAARAAIQGMVSIDMVGYGSTFNVRSLGVGSPSVVNSLKVRAGYVGQSLVYLRDPGWSDHDSFELVGIPAAWLEWRDDPLYHTTGDTAAHVQPSRVRVTGRLVRGWVLGMTPAGLDSLR